jgi:hypothetical protein
VGRPVGPTNDPSILAMLFCGKIGPVVAEKMLKIDISIISN